MTQVLQIQTPKFNSLPVICQSVKTFEKLEAIKTISTLGHIFRKYDEFENYGLVMVHRHFDLEDGEILVEAFNPDRSKSVAMPWKNDSPTDETLFQLHSLQKGKFIFPQTWSFSQEGVLFPYEYVSTNEDLTLERPDEDFVAEVFQALKASRIESVVGLRRLLTRREKESYEITPEGVRASVTSFGEKPKEIELDGMVKILWYFTKDGKIWNIDHCGNCCGNCCSCQCRTV